MMDITNKTKRILKISAYMTGTAGEVKVTSEVRPGKTFRFSEQHNDIYIEDKNDTNK